MKHIIFDCDGVLWSGTNDGYFHCYHQAALDAGIDLDFDIARKRILKNWGQSAVVEVEGMIPNYPDRVEEVVSNYRRLVHSDMFLGCAKLIPGADTALERLKSRYALSAITGMNAKNLEILLNRFCLRSLFRHVISTGDIDDPLKAKNTGYHLGKLLSEEALNPNEALVVGDAMVDVQMARQQHVPLVVVLTGHFTQEQAQQLGITQVLGSVADLPEWLNSGGCGLS